MSADDKLDEWLHLVRGGVWKEDAAHRVGYASSWSVRRVAKRRDRADVLSAFTN